MARFFHLLLATLITLLSSVVSSQKPHENQKNPASGLYGETFFFDGHTHQGFGMTNMGLALDAGYLLERGYDAFVFALPVDRSKTSNLFARIENEVKQLEQINTDNDFILFPKSAFDVNYNYGSKKLSAILAIEYFHGVFGGKAELVDRYAELGIHSITLIDNQVDNLFEHVSGGVQLTEFGKLVIDKMNQHNMLIDVRHITEKELVEIVKYSKRPVISSHAHAKGVADLNYNYSDELLEVLKEKNGMVLISFNRNGLFCPKEPTVNGVERLVEHIHYVIGKIGISNVGIGTDLQAYGRYVPKDLNHTGCKNAIISELQRRGYTNAEIEKIMGENYLRMLKKF